MARGFCVSGKSAQERALISRIDRVGSETKILHFVAAVPLISCGGRAVRLSFPVADVLYMEEETGFSSVSCFF